MKRRNFISMYDPKPMSFIDLSTESGLESLKLNLKDGPSPLFNRYITDLKLPDAD